jgi:hypothetical protein
MENCSKKPRLVLTPNGQLKQEAADHETSREVVVDDATLPVTNMAIMIDKTMYDCPLCYRPLKPPVLKVSVDPCLILIHSLSYEHHVILSLSFLFYLWCSAEPDTVRAAAALKTTLASAICARTAPSTSTSTGWTPMSWRPRFRAQTSHLAAGPWCPTAWLMTICWSAGTLLATALSLAAPSLARR